MDETYETYNEFFQPLYDLSPNVLVMKDVIAMDGDLVDENDTILITIAYSTQFILSLPSFIETTQDNTTADSKERCYLVDDLHSIEIDNIDKDKEVKIRATVPVTALSPTYKNIIESSLLSSVHRHYVSGALMHDGLAHVLVGRSLLAMMDNSPDTNAEAALSNTSIPYHTSEHNKIDDNVFIHYMKVFADFEFNSIQDIKKFFLSYYKHLNSECLTVVLVWNSSHLMINSSCNKKLRNLL